MGFWVWFWIWLTLGLTSLVILGLLAKSLLNKSLEVAHQIGRLATKTQKLTDLIGTRERSPEVPRTELITTEQAALARRRFLKTKAKKRSDRARILIKSLKKYDPNESRFH